MSVRRKKDRRGFITEWYEGPKRRSKSFPTRAEAEAWDAEMKKRKRWGAHLPAAPANMDVDAMVTRWSATRAATWAESTRADRGQQLDKWILPFIGAVPLRELGRARVLDWRAAILKAGASPGVANNALRTLSAMLGAAVEDDLLPSNPCARIRKLTTPYREQTILTPLEVERIRAYMLERGWPKDAALVSVLFYAGLRPAEAFALRWGDVGRTLHVTRSWQRSQIKSTKTGGGRAAYLCEPLRADLESIRPRKAGKLAFIFDSPGGEMVNRFNWLARRFGPAREATGIVASPKHGRHTFASLMIHEGRSANEVALYLGHSKPSMTSDTYAHLFDEAQLAPRVSMEDAINQARIAVHGRGESGLRVIEGGEA